jgi:hypothetical protein
MILQKLKLHYGMKSKHQKHPDSDYPFGYLQRMYKRSEDVL